MIAYKVDYTPSDKIELYDMLLSLYSLTVLKDPLKSKERKILRFYMMHGYDNETKDMIILDMGINRNNLNTTNYTLQKRGFLKPHPRNQRNKLLSDELTDLKNTFLKNGSNSGKSLFILNIT